MQKIINLTNSPYDLQGKNGTVRLPAFGEVVGEFTGEYLEILHSSGAVSVSAVDEVELLQAEYFALTGNAPNSRWAIKRLREEVERLKE